MEELLIKMHMGEVCSHRYEPGHRPNDQSPLRPPLDFLRVGLLIAGLMVSALPATAQPVDTLRLDLRDAIVRGLAHNEQYKIALAERERAEALILSARAGIFPRVDLYSSYSRALKRPVIIITGDSAGQTFEQRFQIGTKHSTSSGITAEQTLFEGGGVLAAWKAAQSLREMQIDLGTVARRTLEGEVATTYLDALLAQGLVDVADQTLKQAEAHYQVVDQKYRAGLASEYDHLRAHVRVANARPQLIQAENALRLTLLRLKDLTGLGMDVPLALAVSEPDSADWEALGLDSLVQLARTSRPDVAASRHEIRTRARGIDIYRSERWPSLKLNGSFNWQWNTEDRYTIRERDMSRAWSVGLNLSYSVFDGFRRRGNIQAARVDLKEAELRGEELLRGIMLQIESARSRFLEASERLEAQREAVSEAERGLHIADTRYESGVGTQLEVLDAQVALSTARVFAETARHDRLVARVDWRRAMGAPVLLSVGDDGVR